MVSYEEAQRRLQRFMNLCLIVESSENPVEDFEDSDDDGKEIRHQQTLGE